MSKKCCGCGVNMQCVYPDVEGYVEPKKFGNAEICNRCFKIKYYGDFKTVNKDNSDFVKILKNISKTGDLVLYLVDVFSVDKDLNEIYRYLDNNPIILVITKKDILPKDTSEKKIIDYFKTYDLNVCDSIVISSKKNYNFDLLYQLIRKHKKSPNVYVVGNTNVGKSTFVNRCISNFGDKNANVTTSIFPSTTLDSLSIEISDYLTLIDTPGIISDNNYINSADYKTLKKIVPKKTIKPIVYQFNNSSSLLIDNLARVDYEINSSTKNNDVILYFSPAIKVSRANIITNNNLRELECYKFSVDGREDIVINGLGWIKVFSKATIKIYVPKNVDVYRRNCII